MIVHKSDFDRQIIPDDCPDTSYLEQEGFEDRLARYVRRPAWRRPVAANPRRTLVTYKYGFPACGAGRFVRSW